MSLINRLLKSGKCIIFSSLVLIVVLFLLGKLQDINFGIKTRQTLVSQEISPETKKKTDLIRRFVEISPDGTKQIILYERPFTESGQLDYNNYLSNKYFFVVEEFDNGHENYVFVGDDKVDYPHWLGNNFVFFTGGCGTGCRSLYLVDTRSKESYQGVITTTPVSKDGFITYLHDWFDEKFEFVGANKNIRSVYFDDKTYLIFEMWNNNQYVGEKRFLFTGQALVEQ